MKTFLIPALVLVGATCSTAQPPPAPTERLTGWFKRTSLVDPQPSELPLSKFYAGLENSAWGESVFVTLFFMPNLVVDACGLVHTIPTNDISVMDLSVVFFSAGRRKNMHWNTDLGMFDLTTTTLVARMGPTNPSIVSSSVYAWPTTEIPRIGWYWDWIRWRDEKLQRWLGWPVKEEPRKWPYDLDRVLQLMGETAWCGAEARVRGENAPSLTELLESNPNGMYALPYGGQSAASFRVSRGLNDTLASELRTEL